MPYIRIQPELPCPKCGSPMRLIQPGPTDSWTSFFGYTAHPACKGTRQLIFKNQDQLQFWEEKEAEYKWIKR